MIQLELASVAPPNQATLRAIANRKVDKQLRSLPRSLCYPPRPLAQRIDRARPWHRPAIIEVAGDSINHRALRHFIGYWCSRSAYMVAIVNGRPRVNLAGSITELLRLRVHHFCVVQQYPRLAWF